MARRMGIVIGVKPEKVQEYKELHAAVWPEVLAQIKECGISNYTIFLREPENLLFACWEYSGSDFAADIAKMSAHQPTRRSWEVTGLCQVPLTSRQPGEHWAIMEEVFHLD